MVGRYGTDELNRFLLTAVLVMILGNVFARNRLVFWLEAICLILCYFRMFSRNTGRRFQENPGVSALALLCGGMVPESEVPDTGRTQVQDFQMPGLRAEDPDFPRGHGKDSDPLPKCGREFFGRS